MDESNLMELELTFSGIKYVFINVYMPYCSYVNFDDLIAYLSTIDSLVGDAETPYVYAIGDFNADISKAHSFGNELLSFCRDVGLTISDSVYLQNCYTFVSSAHHTTSWLDHVVCTTSAHKLVCDYKVHYDKVSSDHLPLSMCVKVSGVHCAVNTPIDTECKNTTIRWANLDPNVIHACTNKTEHLLSRIKYSSEICVDTNCQCPAHISSINTLYDDICNVLLVASEGLRTTTKNGYRQLPEWTEYCKELHSHARDAFLLWRAHGNPKHGVVFDMMRRSRAHFKYSLRQCKQEAVTKNADILACKFLDKDKKTFWKDVKSSCNSDTATSSTTIAGVTGPENICKMWYTYFSDLLNTSKDFSKKESVLRNLADVGDADLFSTSDIKCIIKNLKKEKSPGLDNIYGEHFIYAHDKLSEIICILFNTMLIHNHIPQKFMDTIIIPLIKDKKGDVSDCNNYRPIALTCIMSKILESAILKKYQNYFITSDHQFGFKPKHGTDQCIFVLKEIIDLYTSSNSPMYLCFMDASKAFDRVNHYSLFEKLLNKGVPAVIVRLICKWYTTQRFLVKWSNCISKSFSVVNGVRQGGILSPILFNIYIDSLSDKLSKTNAGCVLDSVCFNHLFYADDSVIMAPSPSALQQLLLVCEEYGLQYELLYNTKKTVCMAFLPKCLKKRNIPKIHLCGVELNWVQEYKYLGFYITENMSDNRDMQRQLRFIYAKGNILVRKFRMCSVEIKLQLFRSYCYNLYCCHLWSTYTQARYNSVQVAYNNVFRHLLNIKGRHSISQIYMFNRINSFVCLLRKSVCSFRSRLYGHQNVLINTIIKSAYFLNTSKLFNNWSKQIF
jgi:hypothetical protein